MTDEEILIKYEELIKSGYCNDCNELNCLDSNASYRLLEIIKKYQKSLDKACEELHSNSAWCHYGKMSKKCGLSKEEWKEWLMNNAI